MKRLDSRWSALSVQISAQFHDTILSTRLLRVGEGYSVGEGDDADAEVPVPDSVDSGRTIVRAADDGHWLCFADGMSGRVETDGRMFFLSDLAARPETRSTECGYEWPIAPDARCRIDLGVVILWVESVESPEPIARQLVAPGQRENQKYNGLSALAHALILFLVFSLPPTPPSLAGGLMDGYRKVSTLIVPPAPEEEKIPEWMDRPAPTAPAALPSTSKERGPSRRPQRGTSADAKKLAVEAVAGTSFFTALQSPGSNLSKVLRAESAFGGAVGEALDGLESDLTAFNEYGIGTVPMGGGGPGQSIGAPSYGAILGGDRGRGGRRPSGPPTVYRKHRTMDPTIRYSEPIVRGSLDKEIIRRIVRRHLNEVRYCYEKELVTHNDLSGRVTIRFTIGGAGRVLNSLVQKSSLGNTAVETCVAKAVARWQFPQPKGGAFVVVSYPFVLRAAGE